MEKKICTGVVNDLKELLGDEVANELICGFLQASDKELQEFRSALEPLFRKEAVSA
ncbi:hypothetical protein [Paenibacillus sp.]|uniref:hypothetical protein n=1 Tax=Paenibacillus sp. TaxID=58172 RepID=UPI002D2691E2|nr:hypothetical protein [Paenibacillus sp.]HZG57127.1 hypothetical protein [Paenibacillus sp.]